MRAILIILLLTACNAQPIKEGNLVIYRPIKDHKGGESLISKVNNVTCSLALGSVDKRNITEPTTLKGYFWIAPAGSDTLKVNPGDYVRAESLTDGGIFAINVVLTKVSKQVAEKEMGSKGCV